VGITRHAAQQAQRRAGLDLYKFVRLLKSRGLSLPKSGTIRTELCTLIIQGGNIVTVLGPEMVAVRRTS
jgi:hypothetical protein